MIVGLFVLISGGVRQEANGCKNPRRHSNAVIHFMNPNLQSYHTILVGMYRGVFVELLLINRRVRIWQQDYNV